MTAKTLILESLIFLTTITYSLGAHGICITLFSFALPWLHCPYSCMIGCRNLWIRWRKRLRGREGMQQRPSGSYTPWRVAGWHGWTRSQTEPAACWWCTCRRWHEVTRWKIRNLPFPPEVFLNLRTKGRHEVVEVHYNMDTNVEEHEKRRVTTTNKPK